MSDLIGCNCCYGLRFDQFRSGNCHEELENFIRVLGSASQLLSK